MLDTDVVELLESGGSLIVGTVDEDARPAAARGWGIEVQADRTSLRVLVCAATPGAVANLTRGGRVAVTVTAIATLRSIQVKGQVHAVEPATAADRERHVRYVSAFTTAVHESDRTPLDQLLRMRPEDVIAFVMTVEDLYDQTPGPTAGQRLTP